MLQRSDDPQDNANYIMALLRSNQVTLDDVRLAATLGNNSAKIVANARGGLALGTEAEPLDGLFSLPAANQLDLFKKAIYLVDLPPELKEALPSDPKDLDDTDLHDPLIKFYEKIYGRDLDEYDREFWWSWEHRHPKVSPAEHALNVLQYVLTFPDDPEEHIRQGLENVRLSLGDGKFFSFLTQELLPPELH